MAGTPFPLSPLPAATDHGDARSVLWQLPRLQAEDRIVGGLAAGIAREVGLDPLWVRCAFVLLFALGGWGGLLYLVGWGVVAGLEYAGHGAAAPPVPKARSLRARRFGFVLAVLGVGTLVAPLALAPVGDLWPVAVIGVGALLVWRQIGPRMSGRRDGRWGLAQVIGGFVLAAVGVGLVATALNNNARAGTYVVIGGVLLVVFATAPWWWRMVQTLDQERQARIRSDERAEVAAHLHDSVLQTLALIQKNDGDANAMVALARRQERELRNWLDPDRASRRGGSLRGRLDDVASEVEELYAVPVEIVAVGDCLVDDDIEALLGAAREAVVNAAKHSGAGRVDVYAEVGDDRVELFVRDTGIGFDPSAVAADRRGLTDSIHQRVARVGGSVEVHSEPGEGTEIEIQLSGRRNEDPS